MALVQVPTPGSMIEIASGSTTSGSTITISNIPQNYKNIILSLENTRFTTNALPEIRFNSDTTGFYGALLSTPEKASPYWDRFYPGGSIPLINPFISTSYTLFNSIITCMNYSLTSISKAFRVETSVDISTYFGLGSYKSTSAITSISIIGGTFNNGSYKLYGVN